MGIDVSEREEMPYDVAIVGAGPAGLACAIRLKQKNPEIQVCVLEKGSEVGSHILSGAVIEPEALDELYPDWKNNKPSPCVPVEKDQLRLLTEKSSIKLPTPPQMHNKGNYIVSLGSLCQKLAEHAESIGVEIFPGFAAASALFDEENQVRGVRVGDMGVDSSGNPKDSYMQGIDIIAKTTVFAEGCRGHVSKQLIKHYALDNASDPQTYGIGLKELWQLPEGKVEEGKVMHTVGWPLDNDTYGGSFIYHLDNNRLAIGFVVGLDYKDPCFSPFEAFQQFKHHPEIKQLLEGGEIISAGSRALAEGGIQSLPKVEMPGAMLIGDTAGLLNVPKIKGVHQVIRSGMLAADHIVDKRSSAGFDQALRKSRIVKELKKVRNIRPGFHGGLWMGMTNGGLETVLAGFSPWTLSNHADHEQLKKIEQCSSLTPNHLKRDLIPRDRLASVYFSATEHDEDQPVHLQIADTNICIDQCAKEYANPCTRFCPAGVYEIVTADNGQKSLQINASNCIHCKTCDIKDPYQQINWVAPEGASGPNYQNL